VVAACRRRRGGERLEDVADAVDEQSRQGPFDGRRGRIIVGVVRRDGEVTHERGDAARRELGRRPGQGPHRVGGRSAVPRRDRPRRGRRTDRQFQGARDGGWRQHCVEDLGDAVRRDDRDRPEARRVVGPSRPGPAELVEGGRPREPHKGPYDRVVDVLVGQLARELGQDRPRPRRRSGPQRDERRLDRPPGELAAPHRQAAQRIEQLGAQAVADEPGGRIDDALVEQLGRAVC